MQRILIVEDSPRQAKWLASVLEREGYDVDTALDAETAFQRIATNLPDLVLADLRLPGQSGIELCRQIRDSLEAHQLPVLLITGWADPVNVLRGLEAGADGIVVKGSTVDSILFKIRQVLNRELATIAQLNSGVNRFEFCGEQFEIPNDRNRLLNVLLTTFSSVYDLSQRHQQEIQDRKQTEAELRAAHDEEEQLIRERTRSLQERTDSLEHAHAAYRDFMSVAASDLRKSLGELQAFTGQLRQQTGATATENFTGLAHRVDAAIRDATRLIDHLLSHPDAQLDPVHETAAADCGGGLIEVNAPGSPR